MEITIVLLASECVHKLLKQKSDTSHVQDVFGRT